MNNKPPMYKEQVVSRKIDFHCYTRFFNPLKKRVCGELIPFFQLLPVIGIGIDREFLSLCIDLGWLNFYCHIQIQLVITKKLVVEGKEMKSFESINGKIYFKEIETK